MSAEICRFLRRHPTLIESIHMRKLSYFIPVLLLGTLCGYAQTQASCAFHYFQIPSSTGTSVPEGMNSWGTIVGYISQPSGSSQGFVRYSNGGTNIYAAPLSTSTTIMRRSGTGVNVGFYLPKGATYQDKGFVASGSSFQSIIYPSATATYLTGINKWGSIVGYWMDVNGFFHGFELQNGKFFPITYPGSYETVPSAINDNGVIAGTYYNTNPSGSPGPPHGFTEQGGVYKTIFMNNGDAIQLSDINNTGEIVGADVQGTVAQAFIYKAGVFKFISVPNSTFTAANGISPAEVVVGNASVPNSSGGSRNVNYTATCQ